MNFVGKEKEYIADVLSENPVYDAGWVDVASELLSKYVEFNEELLAKFSAEQLNIIKQGAESYSKDLEFMNLFVKPELNSTQMQIILTAKAHNAPNKWISTLSNPKLHYAKGNYIAQGMVDGFNLADDIDIYKFTTDQVYEIFAGIKSEVDWKKYANPKIPAESMGVIRHALQLGFDVTIKDVDIFEISK